MKRQRLVHLVFKTIKAETYLCGKDGNKSGFIFFINSLGNLKVEHGSPMIHHKTHPLLQNVKSENYLVYQ